MTAKPSSVRVEGPAKNMRRAATTHQRVTYVRRFDDGTASVHMTDDASGKSLWINLPAEVVAQIAKGA